MRPLYLSVDLIITSNTVNFLSAPKGKVTNKERGTASLSYV